MSHNHQPGNWYHLKINRTGTHIIHGQKTECSCGEPIIYLCWYDDDPPNHNLLYWYPQKTITEWP